MTGMTLLVCCSWAVLRFLSVQAYENLAYHQPTWQSDTLLPFGADLAVDGRFTELRVEGGQCAVSLLGQTAEWRVDLGGVKSIHHVILKHVMDGKWHPGIFLGFSVYISNKTDIEDGVLCFSDTNFTTTTIPNPVNIICPYHGRYVIYYNKRTHLTYPQKLSRYTMIGLCEVEVYGCQTLGNCSLECPQNCQDGYCDIVEGTCLACKPGFIGPRCMVPVEISRNVAQYCSR
uniref:Uncharacterized protein LOC111111594 n=1 Tax=Crassostrea virginica TaxID=6565 RepID=A0A8B8BM10_CRAVI|nr:uncharacterized protein LOC111111594 [Crassostrea virginica]